MTLKHYLRSEKGDEKRLGKWLSLRKGVRVSIRVGSRLELKRSGLLLEELTYWT